VAKFHALQNSFPTFLNNLAQELKIANAAQRGKLFIATQHKKAKKKRNSSKSENFCTQSLSGYKLYSRGENPREMGAAQHLWHTAGDGFF